MLTFLRQLFCRHKFTVFVRNLYGDQIFEYGARSLWKCRKCGAHTTRSTLYQGDQ